MPRDRDDGGALLIANADEEDEEEIELFNTSSDNSSSIFKRNGSSANSSQSSGSKKSKTANNKVYNELRSSPSQRLSPSPLALGTSFRSKSDTNRKIRTFLLYSAFFSLGLCIALPGPTLLDLEEKFDSTTDEISYIFTGRSVGYMGGSLIGGFVYDRVDKMLVLGASLLLTGIATLVFPWASALFMAVALICFQGFSMGVLDAGGNAMVLQVWGRQSPPYIQGLHFAFGLGAFFAPIIAKPFLAVAPSSDVIHSKIDFALQADQLVRHRREWDGNFDMFPNFSKEPKMQENSGSITTLSYFITKPLDNDFGMVEENKEQAEAEVTSPSTSTVENSTFVENFETDSIDESTTMATVTVDNGTNPLEGIVTSISTSSTTTTVVAVNETIHKPVSNDGSQLAPEGADGSKHESEIAKDAISNGPNAAIDKNQHEQEASSSSTTTTLVPALGENRTNISEFDNSTFTLPDGTLNMGENFLNDSSIDNSIVTQAFIGSETSTFNPPNEFSELESPPPVIEAKSTMKSEPSLVVPTESSHNDEFPSTVSPATSTTTTTTTTTTSTIASAATTTFMDITKALTTPSKVHTAFLIVAIINVFFATLFITLGIFDRCRNNPCVSAPFPSMLDDDYNEDGGEDRNVASDRRPGEQRSLSSSLCPSGFHIQLLVLLSIFYCLYVGGEVSFGQFISAYSEKSQQWTRQDAAYLASAFWGALAAGRAAAIPLSHVIKPSTMIAFDLTLLTVAMLGLLIGVKSFDSALWLCAAMAGFGMSSIFASGLSWAERYIPMTGKVSGILIASSGVGEMILPVLAGFFFSRNPDSLAYLMSAISFLLAVLFVLLQNLALNGIDSGQFKSAANKRNFAQPDDDDIDQHEMRELNKNEVERLLPIEDDSRGRPKKEQKIRKSTKVSREEQTKAALQEVFDRGVSNPQSSVLIGHEMNDDEDEENFFDAFAVSTPHSQQNKSQKDLLI